MFVFACFITTANIITHTNYNAEDIIENSKDSFAISNIVIPIYLKHLFLTLENQNDQKTNTEDLNFSKYCNFLPATLLCQIQVLSIKKNNQ